jgi:subtilase family protein
LTRESLQSHVYEEGKLTLSCGNTCGISATLGDALDNAFAAGMLAVTSMGNQNGPEIRYPAAYHDVSLAVGAINPQNHVWDDNAIPACAGISSAGSNWGVWIDLAAPGGRPIPTTLGDASGGFSYQTFLTNCLDYFAGTSASSGYVAGIAGLLKSRYPVLTGEEIGAVLKTTARDNTDWGVGWDYKTGWGIVRADSALRLLGRNHLVSRGAGAGAFYGSVQQGNAVFDHPPTLANGNYGYKRHEVRLNVSFPTPFLAPPLALARMASSVGWSDRLPHYSQREPIGWAEVVPGSVTTTGCAVRTYVYEIFNVFNGSFIGWFPTTLGNVSIAWSAIGQVLSPAQSFYVPQSGTVASPTEGAGAIVNFRTCPNNDNGSFPNNARIKIVAKNGAGAPIPNVAASDIYILFNGGTAAQGFYGAGADSIIANNTFNPAPPCPNVRAIFADAPTDANGTTYITFMGATPGSPGVATRDPQRKWGHYDTKIPVFIYGIELQGRLTSASANGSYGLQVKNFDFWGGLDTQLNMGEVVNSSDLDYMSNHLGGTPADDPQNWWADFNNDGTITTADINMIVPHSMHDCDTPNNP